MNPAATLLPDIELRRPRALAGADTVTAAPLHADDYQLITPNGSAIGKADYLGAVASGQLRYQVFEPVSEMAGAGRRRGRGAAVPRSHQFRRRTRLHLLAHGLLPVADGTWQVVWSQATAIAQLR